MKFCQIMNWAHDRLGQVASGKRFWEDRTPVADQPFEYAFGDVGNRKTTGRGGDYECVPNSGTLSQGGKKHLVRTRFEDTASVVCRLIQLTPAPTGTGR